jgi:hypothetical protein
MATESVEKENDATRPEPGITRVSVAGFKSIRDEQSIEIRPLTILAGANSSGKSSIMQPLLLLKQTLEASHEPQGLLLDGPNVRFSDASQFLSRSSAGGAVKGFGLGIEIGPDYSLTLRYEQHPQVAIDVARAELSGAGERLLLTPITSSEEIRRQMEDLYKDQHEELARLGGDQWHVVAKRGFLWPAISRPGGARAFTVTLVPGFLGDTPEERLTRFVHVPGFRGSPQRAYPATAVEGLRFPGVFPDYTAGTVSKWQEAGNGDILKELNEDLAALGLCRDLTARRASQAYLELYVSRLPGGGQGRADDLVSVADVGVGVSQALPVVVALHAATPENLVYLEEPELHLHPRAQVALAAVLARAVQRGVRMVVETHSQLLLLAVQALVAEGRLSPDAVKLHWFSRSPEDGVTTVASADLDESGAFGDWPEDFGDVELEADKRYLDAVESKLSGK